MSKCGDEDSVLPVVKLVSSEGNKKPRTLQYHAQAFVIARITEYVCNLRVHEQKNSSINELRFIKKTRKPEKQGRQKASPTS